MRIALIVSVVASLFITACGGGGGGGDAEAVVQTGVLQGGTLKGVTYRTPTRSGVTDGAGSFQYTAGETVTFSIGGIELGAATGAAQISLFTLAGLAPPSTELALRRELRRMQTISTPFRRAANLSALLLALDVDANMANGIDVTGRAAALANAHVDFDARLRDFAPAVARLAPHLQHKIPFTRVFGYLYRPLALRVAGNVVVSQSSDQGPIFGTLTTRTHYDSNGELDTSTNESGSGAFTPGVTTVQRDAYGRIRRLVTEYDFDSDGHVDFSSTNDITIDDYGDESRIVATRASASVGVPVFGFDQTTTTIVHYDDFGRLMSTATTDDLGSDGAADSFESQTVEPDADGNVGRVISARDDDADGATDRIDTITFSYLPDGANQRVTQTFASDDDANGTPESLQTISQTFNPAGFVVASEESADFDADGILEYDNTTVTSRDAQGRLTHESTVRRTNGAVESRSEIDFTTDPEARVVTSVDRQDVGGDGTVDTVISVTHHFDANGFATGETQTIDLDNDGNVDQTGSVTIDIDANGAEHERTVDYAYAAVHQSFTTEFEHADDALAQIVAEYFPEFGGAVQSAVAGDAISP